MPDWQAQELKRELSENGTSDLLRYLTPRIALQQIGSGVGRKLYKKTWVDCTIRTIAKLTKDPYSQYNRSVGIVSSLKIIPKKGFIITDLRLLDELDVLKKYNFFLIRVKRNTAGLQGPAANHESETEMLEIPDSVFNEIIYNNSTLDDLKINVEKVLSRF
ncbi:MAG: hypothetical protein HC877_22370 [Thioploca sp.]|nr:hypothetical protein [Thioploca sp.]